MGVPQEMDINVARRYSQLREKLLRLTHDALGVKLIGTLEVCGSFAGSKSKGCTVRKKTDIRATNPAENICVNTNGSLPESLFGNRYCIGVLDDYIHYYWRLFTKTRSQPPKKMAEFFLKK